MSGVPYNKGTLLNVLQFLRKGAWKFCKFGAEKATSSKHEMIALSRHLDVYMYMCMAKLQLNRETFL